MSYLLDTCLVSEFVAKKPSEAVMRWLGDQDEARLHISVITIGEIRKGIEKLAPSERRTALSEWLAVDLAQRFEGRMLAIDASIMHRWGVLAARLERVGRPMSALDSLIAATVLHHGLTLVTRNEAHFAAAELPIVNPWG